MYIYGGQDLTILFSYPDFDLSSIPVLVFRGFLSSAIFCIIYPWLRFAGSMSASSVFVLLGTRDIYLRVCTHGWIGYASREIHRVSGFLLRFVPDNDISNCVRAVSQKAGETTAVTRICFELGPVELLLPR